MRFLEPTITCLLISHMKPTLDGALRSIQNQTRLNDVQVIVIDSGQWLSDRPAPMPSIYQEWHDHPNIEWYFTGERTNERTNVCPVAHWTNLAIRQGLIRGRYLCCFFDDDLYEPTFMEKMGGYLDDHPACMAVRCTQRRVDARADGTRVELPPLVAEGPISGPNFDCRVDGGQVMLRTEVLSRIPDPWLPEDPGETCSHSDGIFLNKVGAVIPQMDALNETLYTHQHTVYSTYTPSR
jgi:hypothetical protein